MRGYSGLKTGHEADCHFKLDNCRVTKTTVVQVVSNKVRAATIFLLFYQRSNPFTHCPTSAGGTTSYPYPIFMIMFTGYRYYINTILPAVQWANHCATYLGCAPVLPRQRGLPHLHDNPCRCGRCHHWPTPLVRHHLRH